MKRIVALLAPLAAAMLVGCQTVETTSTAPTPTSAASGATPTIVIPPLQPAVYSNVTPVAGVTYVALDEFTTVFIEELLKFVLVRPDTAQFDRPMIATQEGDVLQVCGTLSASDGSARHALVPFALTLLLDHIRANDLDNAAILYGLGGSVLIRSIPVETRDDAEIRALCRDYLGISLQAPAGARTATAPAIAALTARARP